VAPQPSTRGAATPTPQVLVDLVEALQRDDDVDAQLAARAALHRGASLLGVFEAVLADLARRRAEGAGVLETTGADFSARRLFCDLVSGPPRGAAQALVFTDREDAMTVGLLRLLEEAGLRARAAVTPDPSLVLDLTVEQPWAVVVVDHCSLRRSPQTAGQFLAPLASRSAPRVVVTTEGWGSPAVTGEQRLTWVRRDLRALAGACAVLPESPLTEREREVLAAVAEGRSNEQVGRQLGLSLSTVKTYLERIHVKLGSVDRASAVATALRRGWI
jgi:DNA-binding CsgD family transcriptional regulator